MVDDEMDADSVHLT